ncbi:MAG: hypothetical protein Kow0068_13140 [Marinilabiliales bacterium]
MRSLSKLILLISLFTVLILFEHCNKHDPGKVVVTVVRKDTLGTEILTPNATVTLYTKPNGSYVDVDSLVPSITKLTNSEGKVEFYKDYDCILNIKAVYVDENDRKFSGTGIGIFKLDETYETVIKME